MQAIETSYAGYRFRSRLEARWAVFFDHMNIPWRYEEEGFILESGRRYLPDFYLPSLNCYFEVKGYANNADLDLLLDFKLSLLYMPWRWLYLAAGQIPDPRNPRGSSSMMRVAFRRDSCEKVWWRRCASCGCTALWGGVECNCGGTRHMTDPVLLSGFAAARSARFEHSERESFLTPSG